MEIELPDPYDAQDALSDDLFAPELFAPDLTTPGESEGLDSPPEAPGEAEAVDSPKELPIGQILALANQKGGVGKTTSTISLGAALAEQGARVLLVDFDPQGALSLGVGFNPNLIEASIYNLLMDPQVKFDDVVRSAAGFDVLPASIDLSAAEIQLVHEVGREQMLARALEPGRARYNYILIDCPPSLGLLTINALTAADAVIIPLECEFFALKATDLLEETISKVQDRLNPRLQVKGVLLTMVESRTLHGREVLGRVKDHFGHLVFETVIRKTVRFAEAPVVGESILTYAPKSGGADEYRRLAREVISR